MKTLILAAIRCSLMFTAVTASLFSVRPAQAYTVTLEEVGSNVVATGSGAINLTGLTFIDSGYNDSQIAAYFGIIVAGSAGQLTAYSGLTGPRSFGDGQSITTIFGSGDIVGVFGIDGAIVVPLHYHSGNPLSGSATWNNATFATLGVTPGTYVWRWGAGANQNFTLQIGPAGVPDGGSTVSLLGCALLGLAAMRRKLGC
jgi:hypothetical protein